MPTIACLRQLSPLVVALLLSGCGGSMVSSCARVAAKHPRHATDGGTPVHGRALHPEDEVAPILKGFAEDIVMPGPDDLAEAFGKMNGGGERPPTSEPPCSDGRPPIVGTGMDLPPGMVVAPQRTCE